MLNPHLHQIYCKNDHATHRYYVDICVGQMHLIADAAKMKDKKHAAHELFWSALVLFEHTLFYRSVLPEGTALHALLSDKDAKAMMDLLVVGGNIPDMVLEKYYLKHDMGRLTDVCVSFVREVHAAWTPNVVVETKLHPVSQKLIAV